MEESGRRALLTVVAWIHEYQAATILTVTAMNGEVGSHSGKGVGRYEGVQSSQGWVAADGVVGLGLVAAYVLGG